MWEYPLIQFISTVGLNQRHLQDYYLLGCHR